MLILDSNILSTNDCILLAILPSQSAGEVDAIRGAEGELELHPDLAAIPSLGRAVP
ncbi:hypothetical protein [Bradyrhizobium jicamae]|uniref:hypothetical protein n=1 Tax=Bradyrhizobium jicamae TaxID=280332 RepID=UPI001BA55368|nr:hypothetical protein [Bradyrhizobium jicamae]MBR0939405.1 hypothetical protein [Bradyrhizobium jicamae]